MVVIKAGYAPLVTDIETGASVSAAAVKDVDNFDARRMGLPSLRLAGLTTSLARPQAKSGMAFVESPGQGGTGRMMIGLLWLGMCEAAKTTATALGGAVVGAAAGAVLGSVIGCYGEAFMSGFGRDASAHPDVWRIGKHEMEAYQMLLALRFAQADAVLCGVAGALCGVGLRHRGSDAGAQVLRAGKALGGGTLVAQGAYLAGGMLMGGLNASLVGGAAWLLERDNWREISLAAWFYASHAWGTGCGLRSAYLWLQQVMEEQAFTARATG